MTTLDRDQVLALAAQDLLDWLTAREGQLVDVRSKDDAESLDDAEDISRLCDAVREALLDRASAQRAALPSFPCPSCAELRRERDELVALLHTANATTTKRRKQAEAAEAEVSRLTFEAQQLAAAQTEDRRACHEAEVALVELRQAVWGEAINLQANAEAAEHEDEGELMHCHAQRLFDLSGLRTAISKAEGSAAAGKGE